MRYCYEFNIVMYKISQTFNLEIYSEQSYIKLAQAEQIEL